MTKKNIPSLLIFLLIIVKYVVYKDLDLNVYYALLAMLIVIAIITMFYNFKNNIYKNNSKKNKLILLGIGVSVSLFIYMINLYNLIS
jgi:hypothetical protein